nr:immunoglobulin light chain junction region [Macaca mulatta]
DYYCSTWDSSLNVLLF